MLAEAQSVARAPRAGMSEVKFKVRANALALQEFTAAELVRATGLNPESVRTELQRMKQDGLVAPAGRADTAGRGARPLRYRLSPDAATRRALAESIEAFYPARLTEERPTSRYYEAAARQLDAAFAAGAAERRRLLDAAEHDLATAEDAAGGRFAPERVRAQLTFEWGRLAYLRGDYQEARERFEAVRRVGASAEDDESRQRIDEFLLCLKLRRLLASGYLAASAPDEPDAALTLVDVLEALGYRTANPLLALLLEFANLRWSPGQQASPARALEVVRAIDAGEAAMSSPVAAAVERRGPRAAAAAAVFRAADER